MSRFEVPTTPVALGTAYLAVTSTSAYTALPVARALGNNRYLLTNSGAKIAYFEFGTYVNAATASKPVAVVASASVAGAQTYTNDTSQPADGSTVVIGNKTFTFQTTLTNVDGHVKIGASANASTANLYHAINGSGGTIGTDYAAATVPHTQVIATTNGTTTVTVTALTPGVAGNSIATTASTSPNSHGTWGAATLASGANNNGGTAIAAGAQLMVYISPAATHIAAICAGSDSTDLFITSA